MRNGGPASTFFAGREAELARLEEALRSAPIAIVSGLPGVGKTAVAARLAARIEENRKLPLLWVQATEEGDLLEKIDAALRARGIEELSPYMARGELSHQERWMTLCAILRRCPSLLAIDDVHALGLQEAAELLRLLAVHLGPSRAIATTRVRLQTGLVEGVQSIELVLEGLPGAEAAAMLSELLGGAPSSGPQLLRLAEALGGHPLSLRLAASALAEEGMTPLELLEQTSPRREELGREMLERVHTSLSLAERRLLSALSVFREPAAPEAVSALVGPEVLELAGRLEDRFVAGRRANGRLDLHPLIREHALARLPETERDRLRLALSRWYEAQAAEAEDLEALVEAQHHAAAAGEDGRAYQLLLRVLDRLLLRGRYRELGPMLDRALATIYEPDVRLALAKARLLRNQGRPAEARHLLAEMTAREDPRERAMVLAEQALLEQDAGRYEKALKLYYQALESARADDDLGQSAKLLARIATICKDRGEYARAVKMYEQAADLERKHGTVDGVAFTLHNLAKIHYFQGDHEKAMAAHMEALEMWEGAGDRLSALLARNGVANILRDRGLVQQAEETYEKNLAEYRALANPFGESYTLANLAHIRMCRGENAAAEEMLHQSVSIAQGIGNRLGEALALDRLGDLRRAQGRFSEARDIYAKALAIKREMRNDYGLSITLNCLGDLEREVGDYTQAQSHYDEALTLCRQMRDRDGTARALEGKAVILADRGELHSARAQFQEALELRRRVDERRALGRALSYLGQIAGQSGETARAFEFYKEAMEVFQGLANRREIQRTLGCLAQLHANLEEYERAAALAAESLHLARELGDAKGEAIALTQLGQIALYGGKTAEAESRLEESMQLRERLGDRRGVVACLEPLALARLEAGKLDEAAKLLSRALELAEQSGFRKLALLCRAHQALLAVRTERLDDAERALPRLEEEASALGFSEGLAYCLRLRGFAACHRGRAEEAAELLRRSQDLYRKLALGRETSRLERELEEVGKDRLMGRLERRRGMTENSRRLERQLLASEGKTVTAMVVDLDEPERGLPEGVPADRRACYRDADTRLTRLIVSHGGEPVRVVGKALLALFPEAGRALEAAKFLRVSEGRRRRIGLDTGLTLAVGAEVFGEPIGLACRFHGLAGAGEIVLTDATLAALGEPRPAVAELPRQRVRGRVEPVRVYRAE